MKRNTWKKLTALLLVVVMVAAALPFAALATHDQPAQPAANIALKTITHDAGSTGVTLYYSVDGADLVELKPGESFTYHAGENIAFFVAPAEGQYITKADLTYGFWGFEFSDEYPIYPIYSINYSWATQSAAAKELGCKYSFHYPSFLGSTGVLTYFLDINLIFATGSDAEEEIPVSADYTVEHWFEDETGEHKLDADATETFTAEIGTEVIAEPITRDGYVLNEDLSTINGRGSVLEDGSLVLKLFYDKIDEEPVEPEDPTPSDPVEPEDPTPSDPVEPEDPTPSDPVEPEVPATFFYMISVSFEDPDPDAEEPFYFKIEQNDGAEVGTTVSVDPADYEDLVKTNEEAAGVSYVLDTDNSVLSGTVTAFIPLKLSLRYVVAEEPATAQYTVKYFFEGEDGVHVVDPAYTKVLTAEVGTEVTAEPITREGYVLNAEMSNLYKSGYVLADGKLELILFYDRVDPNVPDTGDHSNLLTFVVLAVLAVSGLTATVIVSRKSRI